MDTSEHVPDVEMPEQRQRLRDGAEECLMNCDEQYSEVSEMDSGDGRKLKLLHVH